jgi:hypothetical protein
LIIVLEWYGYKRTDGLRNKKRGVMRCIPLDCVFPKKRLVISADKFQMNE